MAARWRFLTCGASSTRPPDEHPIHRVSVDRVRSGVHGHFVVDAAVVECCRAALVGGLVEYLCGPPAAVVVPHFMTACSPASAPAAWNSMSFGSMWVASAAA